MGAQRLIHFLEHLACLGINDSLLIAIVSPINQPV